MRQPSSNMSHTFSQVPRADMQRASFNRSHGFKTTFNGGALFPCFVDEVLPGDTFNVNMTAFGRMATPLHPIMDNIYFDTFFFFVPNRLLWDNWEKFNGAQANPGDTTDYVVPHVTPPAGGWQDHSMGDYYGLPTNIDNLEANAFYFRAYNLIWNEWFRDQNLQDSLEVPTDDGPDLPALYPIQKRGKRHDYFTSCLPFPQKGPAVPISIGDSAPITGIGIRDGGPASTTVSIKQTDGTSVSNLPGWLADDTRILEDVDNTGFPDIRADLSQATAITVNELRQAFQVQRLFERDARGGTRYTEVVRAHFGVTSPDARLQRPEYLGGGSSPINISPIAQTSASGFESGPVATTPQGNLAAIGTINSTRNGFTKSFTEHGVIIGLAAARADLNYQQGLDRMWSRKTRFDYYWPALSHLGEQAVLAKELVATGDPLLDDAVFGYQEIYGEYRYKPSRITGQFRSNFAQSLDTWHLAQDLFNPVLNAEFIEDDPPIDRVIAVVDGSPQFILDCYFKVNTARPMPLYGVPGLIDHF